MTRLKFLREYAKRFPPSGMTARSNIIKPWWPVPSSSGMPAPVFYRGPGDRLAQPPKSTSEIPPHSHETTTECHDRPLFWPPPICSCFGCANFFEIEMFQNNHKPPAGFREPGLTLASRFLPVACGLQLFWMRQFLRNRDVPKQLQTSGWFPKPRVTRPLASRLASRWRHLGVTFSSGRLRIAVVLEPPISSKSRCSKTTTNLRLISENPASRWRHVWRHVGVTLASRFSALFKINVFNDVWFPKINNCLFITNNYCYICSL